ncbi:HEAT repeat domain-containing protein [Candidatus Omnitrophota bacterium]
MTIKLTRKHIIICLIVIIIGVTYPVWIYTFWATTAPFSDPDMISEIKEDYGKLSSDELIDKVKSFCNPYSISYSSPYPMAALEVLVDRQESKAVPMLIKFLDSKSRVRRQAAIWALGIIGDKRAIEPLMQIIQKGEKHSDYRPALLALSEMKYEGAFPYVEQIARKPYPESSGAITYLKEFGKPEGIALLLAMKSQIKDTDPLARFDRSRIDDAVEHIKSLQRVNK